MDPGPNTGDQNVWNSHIHLDWVAGGKKQTSNNMEVKINKLTSQYCTQEDFRVVWQLPSRSHAAELCRRRRCPPSCHLGH
eukprot:364100-Chlamydomonas_euryale.AAC.29